MLPELDLELTMEQKFQLQVLQNNIGGLPREDLEKLYLNLFTMLSIKDNIIRKLLKYQCEE